MHYHMETLIQFEYYLNKYEVLLWKMLWDDVCVTMRLHAVALYAILFDQYSINCA